jgi:hypothetical protein
VKVKTVTVVLNGYKRQCTLARQIQSIKEQSYPVEKILYFNLKSREKQFIPDYELLEREGVEFADTSHDYGVWGRFTFALNAKTDFVCIMDDDIAPGKRYIENCVRSYEKKPGIYGTTGAVIDFKDKRLQIYGWQGINNTDITQVNYLYQTWFMPREALHAFWSEMRPEDLTRNRRCGEDMNLTLMAKKVLGLKTYVVPHPPDNREYWGNIIGDEYNNDKFAIHLDPVMLDAMRRFFKFATLAGMEVVGAPPLLNIKTFINRILPGFILRRTRKKWVSNFYSKRLIE